MPDMKIGISGCHGAPETKYGKILIIGRSQSGKTTVAKKLAEMTGLELLKTSTSRPRRTPDEDTYHFYTPEEAAAVPPEQKLFLTMAVDGFERWTDRDDFLRAGIAVLDPTGAAPAVKLWQAQGYRVTILYCGSADEVRRSRWMENFAAGDRSDWDQAVVAFEHREQTEAPMFDRFEKTIQDVQDGLLDNGGDLSAARACGEDRMEKAWTCSMDMDAFLPDFLERLSGSGGLRPERVPDRPIAPGIGTEAGA